MCSNDTSHSDRSCSCLLQYVIFSKFSWFLKPKGSSPRTAVLRLQPHPGNEKTNKWCAKDKHKIEILYGMMQYYIWIWKQQGWEVDQEIDGKMKWRRMEDYLVEKGGRKGYITKKNVRSSWERQGIVPFRTCQWNERMMQYKDAPRRSFLANYHKVARYKRKRNFIYARKESFVYALSVSSKPMNLQHNYVPNFPEIEQ